jgi:two-component system chemotaxis sensor kinase CheA
MQSAIISDRTDDQIDNHQYGIEILEKFVGKEFPECQSNTPVTVIGHLSRPGYCFIPDEKAKKIYETMKFNHAITEFIVVEGSTAVGFMTRTALNEKLGGRYGFDLHSENPIRNIMESEFFRVDYDMPIEQVSMLAMKRPFEQLYNPVIVEKNGNYSGIVTVKDLLDTCRKIALAERDEIALMRDNLKIGLFFMDKNHVIQDKYSRYLEGMLSETGLYGKSFPEILSASVSSRELDVIKDYFDMLFDGKLDQSMLDDINPLGEINYVSVTTGEKKVFQCEFDTIQQRHGEVFALVSIYDITTETELENRLAEEENRRQEEMKAIFELIQVEPLVFNDFLDDAEYEFDRINETIGNEELSAHNVLVEIYQSVHAIKSNAVILGLDTFGNKVHELETKIKKLREKMNVSDDEMKNLTADLESLSMEKEGFKATIEKINSFKSAGSDGQSQKQYVLIESLSKTVKKTSGDIGKKIKFVVDRIDDEAIDRGPRRIIKEVLMQLIRNSALHGIEEPQDRIAKGKDETGVIRLSIKLKDEKIHVKLGDDGRGINYKKIAEKALRLNLINKKDAEDKDKLLKIIFSPGFSTAETEGVHAGRGIGLNLVRDRVRSENGSIKVETKSGNGTVFNIFFPVGSAA